MRNPKRIKPILKELEKIWTANPDLRLGQLFGNCIDNDMNFYYIEDEDLIKLLKETYVK